MGYVVRKLNTKRRAWKVQYQERRGGGQIWRDVPETELREKGFLPDMTLEEARQIRDSLNAKGALTRHTKKREAIATRLTENALKKRAWFPQTELQEFEARELFRLIRTNSVPYKKRAIHWDAAQVLLTELNIQVSDWFDERGRFYDYFLKAEWSPSYAQKILSLINRWGGFYARRRRVFFEPIPAPSGPDLEALAEAHYERHPQGLDSKPLTPAKLEGAHSQLKPELWNWLFISLWFGLRPWEVDALKKPQGVRTWQLDRDSAKVPLLRVYQTKLVGKDTGARTKTIPCIRPEQKQALKLIESGLFKRPLVKTIGRVCGAGINTYGGRKGFTDLMLDLGQSLENISIWLGHKSIDRTWKSYKDKRGVRWD